MAAEAGSPATLIETILDGGYHLSETDAPFACPVKCINIAPDLSGQEEDLIAALGPSESYALISDANTYEALGRRLAKSLPRADSIVLDHPKADDANVDRLIDRTRHVERLIAVGSGVLNDLCKYVSHLRKRAYPVFPTAPSMNGYVTATASISRRGEKLSLPATPPQGVFIDLGVLSRAPKRLISAGVGDSLCRSTAEIDWHLSHHLLGTPFLASPFSLQTGAESRLLDQAGGLLNGDLQAMRTLVDLLVLGGMGMLIAGGSQPGSQGEHLISHYVDMLCRPHPGSLHGEQVGLATWTMAKLQHALLDNPSPPLLGETIIDAPSMTRRYGEVSLACQQAMQAKALKGGRRDVVNARLEERWPVIGSELLAAGLPPARLKAALDAAGVMLDADNLGIGQPFYRDAVRHARELRDRFTMLDLAADAGRLEPFIEQHLA